MASNSSNVIARSTATKQSTFLARRTTDCFACARNDGPRFQCASAFPRHRCARVVHHHSPLKTRAQGTPGAGCTRSLACKNKKHTSVVTTGSSGSPGIPCAMVLTVSFVLSLVTGLCCHHRRRKCNFRQLDASVGASGPHDFAVRHSAVRQRAPSRPSHPVANVRDDRETSPLSERDGRLCRGDLGQTRSGIFLQRGTGQVASP
jgi:hypothetical protein